MTTKALLALPLVAALLLAGCSGQDDQKALTNCVTQLVTRLEADVPDVSKADLGKFTDRATKACAAEQKKDRAGFDKQYAATS